MRCVTIVPVLLVALALATPAFAQVLDDSGGNDITPDAPAAVDIFSAPGASTISVAPPSVPDVLDTTANGSGGMSVGAAGTASTAGSVSGTGAAISAGSAGTGAAGTSVDPYCRVAADPQATAMGIDSTGCTP